MALKIVVVVAEKVLEVDHYRSVLKYPIHKFLRKIHLIVLNHFQLHQIRLYVIQIHV